MRAEDRRTEAEDGTKVGAAVAVARRSEAGVVGSRGRQAEERKKERASERGNGEARASRMKEGRSLEGR